MTEVRIPCLQSLCTLYDAQPREGCRTGVPVPSGGTTALSAYHAYKSYLFFDTEEIAAALALGSVLSLGLDLESAGDAGESDGTFPLRFYRTDLTEDSSLASAHDGLSAVQSENAHFIRYGEMTAPGKGQAVQNAVFMTGETAADTAEALGMGYALGAFMLKSGRTFSNTGEPWRVRHLENIALVITLNTAPDTPPPPRSLYPRAPYASGSEARLCCVCDSADSAAPVLLISHRDSTAEDASPGPWSEETEALLDEEGIVIVDAPPPGTLRLYRARLPGGSEYTECAFPVTGLPLPVITRVTPARTGRRVIFHVEGNAGRGGARLLLEDSVIGFLGGEQRDTEAEALFDGGNTQAELRLESVYGGSSAVCRVSLPQELPFSPPALTFRGINGQDLGLRLLSLPEPVLREKGEYFRCEGRERDAFVSEGTDVFCCSEVCFALSAENASPGRKAAEYLSGEGDAVFSPLENRVYRMRITSAAAERFSGDGGVTLRVQALLSPFYRRADECPIPLFCGENTVFNAGCVRCSPKLRLECTGGTDSVSVNGRLFRVYGQQGEVIIDAEEKRVITPDGQPAEDTEGDFPFLDTGENTVILSPGTSGSILPGAKYL